MRNSHNKETQSHTSTLDNIRQPLMSDEAVHSLAYHVPTSRRRGKDMYGVGRCTHSRREFGTRPKPKFPKRNNGDAGWGLRQVYGTGQDKVVRYRTVIGR